MSENIFGDRLIFPKVPIIKKRDQFFHRFDGTIIIEIAEGDNLTDINVFSMILVKANTSPKVTMRIRLAWYLDGKSLLSYRIVQILDSKLYKWHLNTGREFK